MAKKENHEKRLSETSVAALLGFVAGVLVVGVMGALIIFTQGTGSPSIKPLRQSDLNPESQLRFTDPLIGLSSSNQSASAQYTDLENKISSYLAGEKSKGLSAASVRFGDIGAQASFVINPSEIYTPASLYKVPLMMAYYKLAEQNPEVLSRELRYTGAVDLDAAENIKSPIQLVPGQSYTVETLIEHMIRYSDNNADQLLLQYLLSSHQDDVLRQIFSDLNVNFGSLSTDTDLVGVQSYMFFIRVLYNATYLDRKYSEKALALMSKTDFTEGISGVVPNDVPVSHKFGDANIVSGGVVVGKELHDCGVVYFPEHPYMLCVMTKGATLSELEGVVSTVSRLVYQDMESRYPGQK